MSLFSKKSTYEVDVGKAVDTWGDTVIRVAHRYMGNIPDAEDVFQTVFMRLLGCKEKITSDEHLKAWLVRVTINCCYDEFRKRHPAAPLEEADAIEEAAEPSLGETSVEKAIDALVPPIRRTVVHLYYYEGYSTDEIAELTGEKPSTIRSHLHRARAALKISLEGANNERE